MIRIESFPQSIQKDFQPTPFVGRRPCSKCFPRNTEDAGEFVDHLLMRIWDEPHITTVGSCISVPLSRQKNFYSDARGLLKVKRNKQSPILNYGGEDNTEYIIELIVDNLEIDFTISHRICNIPYILQGIAVMKFVRFTLDFSVYDEKITMDEVKMISMEELKITQLNAGFLMKCYAKYRVLSLLIKDYGNVAFNCEYTVSKIFSTVLRAFLMRSL